MKYIGSKSKYKSESMTDYIQEYLKAFNFAICPLLGITSKDNKIIYFLNFIILRFPIVKVEKILKKLEKEYYISIDELNAFTNQLEYRKSTAKYQYEEHLELNKCFKLLKNLFERQSTISV